MLEKMNVDNFDWLAWRRGSITDIVKVCRENIILMYQEEVRKYAIGYIESERLFCRPKLNHMAVMYFKNNVTFWSHLTNKEFKLIFGGKYDRKMQKSI